MPTRLITRRALFQATAASSALAAPPPKFSWERHPKPEDAGFASLALESLEKHLFTKPTTTLMVVKAGKIAYSYGDLTRIAGIASMRKSILSMLYGKYVASGLVDISKNLQQLGIDEDPPGLSALEKTATLRDLLMSSSGVYHPAGSPGGAGGAPPRNSHKPGSHFFYNNWDFNAAGAIFQKLTGKPVLQALAEDLAVPLGFQDFDPTRQSMIGYDKSNSRYLAYQMFLSPRDLARLGLVMLRGGAWNGRVVVPAAWVRESTTLRVPSSRIGAGSGPLGYSYMWWNPAEGRKSPDWAGSYLAYGLHGQFILCLPAIDTVIVHARALPDEFWIAFNRGKTEAVPSGGPFTAIDFLKIADAILAARQ